MVIALAACSTFQIPPDVAVEEVSRFNRPGYPSFSGTGSIRFSGGGRVFNGTILLAIENHHFRLEIVDKSGRSIVAKAGRRERIISVDPATGERKIDTGSMIRITDGFFAPVSLLRSMVTGEAPSFSRVISTRIKSGRRLVNVTGPDMELTYTDRLERIKIRSGSSGEVTMALGPMSKGPLAAYVSTVTFRYRNSMKVTVKWNNVGQGTTFADGFFEFDERLW